MAIRHCGLALAVGVLLTFLAPLFIPGFALVDSVDQTDFVAARDALGAAPEIAHAANFAGLIALMLMIFGFVGLIPLAYRQAGLSGKLLMFGIIATIIEWSMLIIVTGMRHLEIHIMQRRGQADDGSSLAAYYEEAALSLHLDLTGMAVVFVMLAPIASAMFGLGLAGRFAQMDAFKIACYVLVAGGVVGLGNFLLAMYTPETGLEALLFVNTIALYIQGLCLILVGFGMYQGRSELSEEAA